MYTSQSLNVQDVGSTGQPATFVKAALSKPFRPGQFFLDMSSAQVKFGVPRDDVLNKITTAADQHFAGELREGELI